MLEQIPEMPGAAPLSILNPHLDYADQPRNGAEISARFFRAPDPRPDADGQPVVNSAGRIPEIEMVEVINRNDLKNTPMIVVATDKHRFKMYPNEYRSFRSGVDMEQSGTPLREWLGENERTRNMAHWHVHTVEQLAAASDSLCQSLGISTLDLRTRAKAYLDMRKDSSAFEKVATENASLKATVEQLSANMERLMKAVASQQLKEGSEQVPEIHPAEMLPDQSPKRRGRPPRANFDGDE